MAQYKTPMDRDQVFESAMRSFKAFLNDQIGLNDQALTPYNELDDEMLGMYNDLTENDGLGHREAMKQVKESFYESLEEILSDGLDDNFNGIGQ